MRISDLLCTFVELIVAPIRRLTVGISTCVRCPFFQMPLMHAAVGPARARSSSLRCAAGAAVLLLACSGVQVRSDYDTTVNFHDFRNYCWMVQVESSSGRVDGDRATGTQTVQRSLAGPSGSEVAVQTLPRNDIMDRRVRHYVDKALLAKGYRRVSNEATKCDFVMRWFGRLDRRLEVSSGAGSVYGSGPYWGPAGGPYTMGDFVYEVDEGTLVLDVRDARHGRLIWRASARSRLSEEADAAELDRLVRRSVDALMRRFPPS